MLVLGIHSVAPLGEELDTLWSLHDAAAVLMRDGEILAAIEEERLDRVKHSRAFPALAVRHCLEQARLTLAEVDRIAVDFSERGTDRYFLHRSLENGSLPVVSARAHVADLFQRAFKTDVRESLRFVEHHRAHLWSAFAPSGLSRGLALSIDGAGDGLSGAVATFEGTELTILREFPVKKSLGAFYRECITLLGYTRFDEYKVMGMAPYGDPARYAELFTELYRLMPDGDYEIKRNGYLRAVEAALIPHIRRRGEPFTQAHFDFAAGLQQALETIVFHVLTHYQAKTGARNLCLAGGVAHNCTLNGRIAYSGLFDHVWVQPAAHDAGNALGAALVVLNDEGIPPKPASLRHLYFGSDLPDDRELQDAVHRWDNLISIERCPNVVERAAHVLADGAVIGWVQGKSEFGPRALGNRSILADPRPAENKERINAMVKKREAYRPFAPSIRQERLGDFFDLPGSARAYPFMTFALRVREDVRAWLGAITHVDGTARLQTVTREDNRRYWELLREFERLTATPILLNTSFNNNAEPIVDSVDDAVGCFLTTGLDALVVGDYLIRKRPDFTSVERLRTLRPRVARTRALVMRVRAGAVEYSLESDVNRYFGGTAVTISEDAAAVLRSADGHRTLGELLAEHEISEPGRDLCVVQEIMDLWTRRAVVCAGASSGARVRSGKPAPDRLANMFGSEGGVLQEKQPA